MSNRASPWLRAILIVTIVAIVALLASASLISQLPLEQMSITIDGERIDAHGLAGRHAVALVCLGAVILVSAIFLVMVVVVLALLAAALGIAVSVLAAVASLLLALSPVLLIVWLLWRSGRKPPSAATPVVVPTATAP